LLVYVGLHHIAPCYVRVRQGTSVYVILRHVMSGHVGLRHVASCYVWSRRSTSYCAMLCRVT